jgi:carboxymethylenebutenolidase
VNTFCRRILFLSPLLAILGVTAAGADDDLVARMAREHAGDSSAASPAAQIDPAGGVMSSTVSYAQLGKTDVKGYLARPIGEGPFPGVIVIHEWWGLNDNIESMADRLAGEGYIALAVDLYEGKVATDSDGAMNLMRDSMSRADELKENLRQAREYLAHAGATRIGSIGWCFGGGWSLQAGLALGDELDAVVIYYGRVLSDKAELAALRAPVLGFFGEDDTGIPVAGVREFERALDELGKPATIHVYPGVGHAFANPSGTRYNEEAADDAWDKTLAFFADNLRSDG